MGEWQLIERHLRDLGSSRDDVALGIGDDAALLRVSAGCELVLTTDALIEGVHFLPGAAARSLGHRALAVNLSDIAAMGACPSWALLSLILPAADEDWLHQFALGFDALAKQHQVALVGGNLSRGPLSITVQLAGTVPQGQALRRDGAHPGDLLYVSGTIGDAATSLTRTGDQDAHSEEHQYLRQRLEYPTPRVALGQALRGIASACIDVSDGLYADAQRLLEASGCGAQLQVENLPLSQPLRRVSGPMAWQAALRGGEDYELCFTAPAHYSQRIDELALRTAQPITAIGSVRRAPGIELNHDNKVMQFSASGFDHFRD